MRKHLVALAKRPLPGYAKTRLGKKIGLEESAGVYARLLYQCLLELVQLDRYEIGIELALTSHSDLNFFCMAFPEFLVTAQPEGDFGARLSQSMQVGFERGAEAVILIGTDIPDLDRFIIQTAFDLLEENDVVLGPDTDGGYYLIGTRTKTTRLFEGIDWSSELVFQQTVALIDSQELSVGLLPTLSDIDTEPDFRKWETKLRS